MFYKDDFLMLSGVQHYAFCPRQWALIHIEQQWVENVRTAEGQILHQRVNDPFERETRGDLIVSRSMPIISHTLKIQGVADIVEFHKLGKNAENKGVELKDRDGRWTLKPVEYKRGKPKIDDRDAAQLCCQAICLEEMFQTEISEGDIFYGEPRRRQRIIFDEDLRNKVITYCSEMYELYEQGKTPSAEKGLNCKLCSLVDICVPRLTVKKSSVEAYIKSYAQNME